MFIMLFGSFGLSAKEPYTFMLCPSCVVVGVIITGIGIVICGHLIFGTDVHLCPPFMYIKYLVILKCILKKQPFWYFDLLSCPVSRGRDKNKKHLTDRGNKLKMLPARNEINQLEHRWSEAIFVS